MRTVSEAQAFAARHNHLVVCPTPILAPDGAPVIALRSDLATADPAERGDVLAHREELHAYMRLNGWRIIKRSMPVDARHAWRVDILASDDRINAVITHDGLPWLYQGTLYDQLTEGARDWVSRATTYGYAELLYFTDPGGYLEPEDADLYEALLDQERALIVTAPISWHIGC